MQDCRSLSTAVTICATPIDIQTHRQHFDQLISIAQPAELEINLEVRMTDIDMPCSNCAVGEFMSFTHGTSSRLSTNAENEMPSQNCV